MAGQIVGFARLVEEPQHTEFHWGDMSLIAGKTLPVLEKNTRGDCLCLGPGGLVDVDNRDIDFQVVANANIHRSG